MAVNLAEFRYCLAEYSEAHTVCTLLWLAYRIGVIEQCC